MDYKQTTPKVKFPDMFPKRKKERAKEPPPKHCTNCKGFWECLIPDLYNGPCEYKYKRGEQIEPWRMGKAGE